MMKTRLIIGVGAILLVLLAINGVVHAQQSRVDSAIMLLNKCNSSGGLDTLRLNKALNLINTAVLTDAQIIQLERAAGQFKKGNDEDLGYVIRYEIFKSLSTSDQIKAIDYGKRHYFNLEQSKTPRANYLAKAFLLQLRLPYRNSEKLPEGFQFMTEQINRYKRANDSLGLLSCYYVLGGFYRTSGLYEPAIYSMKKSVSYSDTNQLNTPSFFGITLKQGKYAWIDNTALLSEYYIQMEDYDKALANSMQALKEAFAFYQAGGQDQLVKDRRAMLYNARHVAWVRLLTNRLDSVDYYLQLMDSSSIQASGKSFAPFSLQLHALYAIKRGEYRRADSLLQQCWKLVNEYQVGVNQPAGYIVPDYFLALLRIEEKKYGEAIALLHKDIERARILRSNVLKDYKLLADLYEKTGDNLRAKEAYKSFILLQDSILADQSKYRSISFETEQQIAQNEIALSVLENKNKISALSRNFTLGIAALLLVLAGSFYYRFTTKKKANAVLEKTLAELKATQSQLIQSEKMASLGEMTAGIAHEIQNPLNFVTNFSDVNKELADELEQEIDKGNYADAKVIAKDIKANEEKINHHGKRADAIVKGMLQHSRSSSGVKEPADINLLCDEYLRLAFHGLKAKDRSFNAIVRTDFDENIGKINIVPQDIGRVLLNLINNAFYACTSQPPKGGVSDPDRSDSPTVWVSTKKEGDKVFISVRDNGPGIPEKILDKIFQPFFTTKPTGEGTGLGLSLSYDIVKAHGGELKVETKEGSGSTFIIELPAKSTV